MAGYTITIDPSDALAGAQTTVRVDTTSGTARVIELTVRAIDGGGLSPDALPALNLDRLIGALMPAQTAVPAVAPVQIGAGSPTAAPQPAVTSARVARVTWAKKTVRSEPAAKAPARSRKTRTGKEPAAVQATGGRRAYRRMPESSEMLAAYRQAGGTTALAERYDVPRHTATGWLRRLRSQGLLD